MGLQWNLQLLRNTHHWFEDKKLNGHISLGPRVFRKRQSVYLLDFPNVIISWF